ncbi:HAD family hydrolase [Thermotoga maritima MSB8]|uniref:NagD protein, putative n=2 Tax=Thermotoga maritima TaxID=2336 RepID=Q9X264_THEMA|nr:HAD-IIA family hydrolase [Thermotoga maritima]AAD36807.1 nagD protein, putative [Thermotoga maritima MSB8]AGL50674.1 putative NagD-like phosphatase [Thermotoga maritima MSB8]AHD18364.1 HAD family hydrolase [Thermotoga maritima MSB8]AKE27624.1 HAD family hydrolase [Thermotoga maritima]AKE29497.1 HAD family hydrolase [Thermotoga maritima MSB8]
MLDKIELFILDMDGTFYLDDSLLPGSLEFLETLKEKNKRFVFFTNNSSLGAQDYVRKLRNMGVDVPDDAVVTSGEITAEHMLKRFGRCRIFLLGTPQLKKVFEAYGHVIDEENPDFVVLGFDKTLTYERLKKACILLRKGKFYIATHPDINCPSKEGPVPDAGSIMAAIEASTGRKPDLIAGKPNPLVVDVISEKFGVPKERMAMVGDRLYTDVKLGKNAGIVSILVLTGETTPEDLERAETKPDFVFKNLGELAKAVQ